MVGQVVDSSNLVSSGMQSCCTVLVLVLCYWAVQRLTSYVGSLTPAFAASQS